MATPGSVPDIGRTGRSDVESKVGPSDKVANRSYKDGFVKKDSGTSVDKNTWNWGHRKNSQVSNTKITFHGDGGIRTEFGRNGDVNNQDTIDGDESGVGPYLEVLRTLKETEKWRYNAQFSGSFIPFESKGSTKTFEGSQNVKAYRVEVIDTYKLPIDEFTGLRVVPPPAPYGGAGFVGPGPVIPNIPSSRNIVNHPISSDSVTEFNQIAESLDVNLVTLSAGIQAEGRMGRVTVKGSAGPTLNWADLEAERKETIYKRSGTTATPVREFVDKEDKSEFMVGGFVQGGISIPLFENVSAGVHGRYDFVEEIDGEVGPSQIEVDLSGYSVLGELGIEF
jgi:hypothetical protein